MHVNGGSAVKASRQSEICGPTGREVMVSFCWHPKPEGFGISFRVLICLFPSDKFEKEKNKKTKEKKKNKDSPN